MTSLFVRHKVSDFETWKKAFDEFVETRKSSGEKSYQIFRPAEDPNNLFLVFEWDNVENAHKFMESSDLKETMQKAGVMEAPEVTFFGDVYKGTV